MQVCWVALPGDRNLVSTQGFGFVVKWLRDVAYEMDQELEGLFAAGERSAGVVDALGL